MKQQLRSPWLVIIVIITVLFGLLAPRLNPTIKTIRIDDGNLVISEALTLHSLSGNVLFEYNQRLTSITSFSGQLISLKGNWANNERHAFGYASYGLIINSRVNQRVALKYSPWVESVVFANGELLYNSQDADSISTGVSLGGQTVLVEFDLQVGQNEIIIQFENAYRGIAGITSEVFIGDEQLVRSYANKEVMFDMFFVSAILFVGLFTFVLAISLKKYRATMVFYLLISLSLIVLAFNIMGYKERLIFTLFTNLPTKNIYFISDLFRGLSAASGAILVLVFKRELFKKSFLWAVSIYLIAYLAFALFLPMEVIESFALWYYSITIVIFWPILYVLIKNIRNFQYDQITFIDDRALIVVIMAPSLYGVGMLFYTFGYWQALPLSYYSLIVMMIALVVLVTYNQIQSSVLAFENVESLKQLDHLKDNFLVSTASQLQKPLINISDISLKLFKDHQFHKRANDVQNLYVASQRLLLLVNDLVDIEKINQDMLTVEKQAFALDMMIKDVIMTQQEALDLKEVSVHFEANTTTPFVFNDPNRLKQALFNLLDYVIEFGSSISLVVYQTKNIQWRLSFKPNNLDLTKAHLDIVGHKHIHQPAHLLSLHLFFKLLEILKIDYQLVVSDDLIVIDISLDYEHIESSGLVSSIAYQQEVLMKQNILLISHQIKSGVEIRSMLFSFDVKVTQIFKTSEALALLSKQKIDAVIIDQDEIMEPLPEIVNEIRQQVNAIDCPIIVLVQSNNVQEIQRLLSLEINEVLRKPVSGFELMSRLNLYENFKTTAANLLQNELRFLQSQIKPHFLFNAISTIIGLCLIDGKQAAELMQNLSDYLRGITNIEINDQFGTLKDEIKLIQSYITIEKARFQDRIQFELDVADESLHFLMPTLLIQPLIENAVKHGVLAKEEGGKVTLKIRVKDDQLYIWVIDDGVGIDVEKLAMIQQRKDQSGVGLSNVMLRLHKQYNTQLEITSHPFTGTQMFFKIKTESKL